MTVTVKMPPEGELTVDLAVAAEQMTAREQARLFRRLGRYISDEDCQRALDGLATAILESRRRCADQVLAGQWPGRRPIPEEVLERFAKAQLPIVMSVCKKPELLLRHEKEHKKEN